MNKVLPVVVLLFVAVGNRDDNSTIGQNITAFVDLHRNVSTTPAREVVISNAWARPALKDGTGGVYLTVTNNGRTAVQIVRASSPDAKSVELHSSTIHDGVAHMSMLETLEVAAGASVSLTPGGKHYMMLALRKALVKGDSTHLNLRLKSGEQIGVPVMVRLQ